MPSPANVDFIRESIITFLADSLDKIAAFVAFVYFANYFTTEAFGAAYTVIGISMMASSLPKAIGVAISKRVSEDTGSHDRFFLLGAGSTLAFVGVVGVITWVVVQLVETRFAPLALAGITHLFARSLFFQVERVFDGVGSTGAAASLDFIDGVFTSLLRFGLILGLGFGAEGLLYSGAISAVMIGGVAYSRRFGIPTTLPTREAAAEISEFAGWSMLARVGTESLHNSATVLAGLLVSPTLASWVRSAQTLVMPADLSVRSVVSTIFVQVSGDRERGAIEISPIQNGIDVASILAIPILGGAIVLGDPLMVTVFGEGYQNAGFILIAVAATRVFDNQARILLSALSGSDNPDAAARVNIMHAVAAGTIFSAALLLAGPTVFAYVLVIVYASWPATAYWYLDRRVEVSSQLSWKFAGEQLVAGSLMAFVVSVASREVDPGSAVTLGVLIGLGAITYGTVLLTISNRGRTIVATVVERVTEG